MKISPPPPPPPAAPHGYFFFLGLFANTQIIKTNYSKQNKKTYDK